MRTHAFRILAGLALIAAAVVLPPVEGADAAPAPVTALPSKIAFGKVHYGQSKTKTVNVKIAAGWQLDSVQSLGDFPTGTPSNCGPGSQACKIPQTFAPTSLGAQESTTTIYVCRISDGLCDRTNVSLTGTGTAPVQFLPAKVAFANVKVGTTKNKKVNLTIDDGWYLNSGADDEPFTWGDTTCVGQPKCSVISSFAPLEVGAMTGTLDFLICPSGGPNTLPCIHVPLPVSGTGTAPVRFTPSKVAFGNVAVGSSKTRKLTLSIDKGWYLNTPYDNGDFTTGGNNCVGQPTCSMPAVFTPSTPGAQSVLMDFIICRSGGPNPPPSCVTVQLPMTGKGI